MPDYFTLNELKALPDMASGYTDARMEAAAAGVVGIIEREVETSFIGRTITDEPHDGGVDAILLDQRFVQSVTTVKENGVTLTDTIRVSRGVLRRFGSEWASTPTRFADGFGNVQVTYVAGYSATVPDDVKEAALKATRWALIESKASNNVSPRQTTITNELGGTVSFATAGPDRPTGYPDVDAVIVGWRRRLNTVTYP
jgi:hypothetical protein